MKRKKSTHSTSSKSIKTTKSKKDISKTLSITPLGLTSSEAKKRLVEFGKNEIVRSKKTSLLKLFISQFSSPLVIILLIAAFISSILEYYQTGNIYNVDSILIFIIVFFSGIAGFVQEYKAEKTIEAIKKMTIPKATVVRDGVETAVFSTEIVPGDVEVSAMIVQPLFPG